MKEWIVKLREETSAGMVDCKKALDKFNGDFEKAKEYLIHQLGEKASKKHDRQTNEGMIAHYIHANKKIGSMVSVKCETDFVAKNEMFQKFAYDIALHITAMNPMDVNELLTQAFVKDASVTINDYLQQTIGKLGENITIDRFTRFEI